MNNDLSNKSNTKSKKTFQRNHYAEDSDDPNNPPVSSYLYKKVKLLFNLATRVKPQS